MLKAGIYDKVASNAFCKSNKGRKLKSRATKIIIESFLNVGSRKQKSLSLNNALSRPKLVNQAADCGYFWSESEKVHFVLTNIE